MTRSGGMQLLTSGTVTNQATLDIVLTSFTAYRGLKFVFSLLPVTDIVDLWARFSTDGGSTYDATGYAYTNNRDDAGGDAAQQNSASANQIICGGANIGNVSNEGIYLEFTLLDQTSTAFYSRAFWEGAYLNSTSVAQRIRGAGARNTAQDTDAIRFLFSSGNIASGNWAVYGLA